LLEFIWIIHLNSYEEILINLKGPIPVFSNGLYCLNPCVKVGGAKSISTILLVDVEVGGFSPYIYVPILLEKDTPKNYNLEFQLENPKVVNQYFPLLAIALPP
jgi:hypothetical protein